MRLLALDFDGVISDSAREAFTVALRAYAELRPGGAVAAAAVRPEPGAHPALYRDFLALLPLGNRAEDYAVALRGLEDGTPPGSQEAYDALYRAQDPAWLDAFHRRFYEIRTAWSERDPEGWLRSMAPYPELLALVRRRAADVALAIATAKDRATVRKLIAAWGAADLFPDERLLDKQAGRSKRAHLEALAGVTGVPLAEVTFVDDKVNHLESVADLGVRCALAAWGYNGAREHARARERGFLVLHLDDAERLLFR